jgi:hypothetical protein
MVTIGVSGEGMTGTQRGALEYWLSVLDYFAKYGAFPAQLKENSCI